MDIFRNFMSSLFPRSGNRPPQYVPTEDDPKDDRSAHSQSDFFHWDGPGDGAREGIFGEFSQFPQDFEDMRKEMDKTFEELFRVFGADSIPMFDPYIPPTHGDNARQQRSRYGAREELPLNANVRDRMLKGADDSQYNDDNVNVRSKMLRRNPDYTDPFVRMPSSDQHDVNWDKLLKEGGTVSDILDGSKRTSPTQPDVGRQNSNPRSVFRYSSITTTRRPDGTIETRRITRDKSGNEKETVEIKGGP